jgi:DNA-binding beta-propeller fold protein YncE
VKHTYKLLVRVVVTGMIAALAAGCSTSGKKIAFPDIHGVGYSNDGTKIYIPAHDGFRVYEDGSWGIPDLPAHDYMGYTPVDAGFYSSGHPHPSAGLPNPLGLVKSSDEGKTLTPLALQGEADFHLLGVGYQNHAIYVYNEHPNSRMEQGLYLSQNDAKEWKKAEAKGLQGTPASIAVHPVDAQVVLVGTEQGLYLSDTSGQAFDLITNPSKITSVVFEPNGNRVLVAGWNQTATMFEIDLTNNGATRDIALPVKGDDAVVYMAINPANPLEIAIATSRKNIYVSRDNGMTWQQIAADGVANDGGNA